MLCMLINEKSVEVFLLVGPNGPKQYMLPEQDDKFETYVTFQMDQ